MEDNATHGSMSAGTYLKLGEIKLLKCIKTVERLEVDERPVQFFAEASAKFKLFDLSESFYETGHNGSGEPARIIRDVEDLEGLWCRNSRVQHAPEIHIRQAAARNIESLDRTALECLGYDGVSKSRRLSENQDN